MTQINANQRQRAKAAASNAAVAANDTAVALGAAGVVVALAGVASGVGALAGVGVGATLALCSFGAWWVSNRYQRLANDPPRNDFDQFLTSTSFVNGNAVPAEEPAATAMRFAAQHVVLADALAALVISLERHDGALDSGDVDAASAQADMVLANARAAISAAGALAPIAAALNAAWTATIPTVAWDDVSITQARDFLSTSVGDPASPGDALSNVLGCVESPRRLPRRRFGASFVLDPRPSVAARPPRRRHVPCRDGRPGRRLGDRGSARQRVVQANS